MWRLLVLLLLVPDLVWAESVVTSPRPMLRPDFATSAILPRPRLRPDTALVVAPLPRPRLRPETVGVVALVPRPKLRPDGITALVPMAQQLIRPRARPDNLSSISAPKDDPTPRKKPPKKGSVCGNRAIRGATLAPITSTIKGCGIAEPVRITEINGISLHPAATLNCGTATALESWITQAVEPTFGRGQVVQFQVAASYACRGRNNVKGARVSEHGRGNAIDIAALVFKDGSVKSVVADYQSLKQVHRAACGIFGTTLGPGSDGYHENHIHFDIARYRSGTYCH